MDWPVPSTQKELRQFLGLASYYRRFVHNFAQLSAPLNRLLDKSRQWLWTEQCGRAFEALKTKLTSAPLLVYPNFKEEFIVDCDASDDGLGAVLSQNFQGTEHVVCYASRTLTKAERKYCATRKEMLALKYGAWASSDLICMASILLHGQTMVLYSGCVRLKRLKARWPDGWNT